MSKTVKKVITLPAHPAAGAAAIASDENRSLSSVIQHALRASCDREGLTNFGSYRVTGRVAHEPRAKGRNGTLAASFAVESSNKAHCGNIALSDLETTHGTAKSDHSAT